MEQTPGATHTARLPPHDQPACTCYPCRRWRYEQRRNGMIRQEPGWTDSQTPKH